jgi:hypothetical protein
MSLIGRTDALVEFDELTSIGTTVLEENERVYRAAFFFNCLATSNPSLLYPRDFAADV